MAPEEEIINLIRSELQGNALEYNAPRPRRVSVHVRPGAHREAILTLLQSLEFTMISTITGIDLEDAVELNYHFWCGKAEVTIRTRVPKPALEIETITDIVPGAALYEREVFDLLGVKFLGHP
ncbi:MAG: NADH-quinone oxidoreductase subunit C, partial [Candidatus Bathyarchaeia archaeon]